MEYGCHTEYEQDYHQECEDFDDYCGWNWDDDGDSVGGSDDGNGNENNANDAIISVNYLDSEGRNILNNILNDLKEQCGYLAMYNYLTEHNCKISSIMINPTSGTSLNGNYYASSKSMVFSGNDVIYQDFPEEFIHFFQDSFYPGGISQYSNTGRSNIEFEAKIMQDILCVIKGFACPYYGVKVDSEYAGFYGEWIEAITAERTRIPGYTDLLVRDPRWNNLNYWDFMSDFCTGNPTYNYPINWSLTPQAIQYINNNGNCNN